MSAIKTKKELINAIQKCCDKRHIKDDNKQKIFDDQVKSIKDVLVGLSDAVEFPQYDSLSFENSFDEFVIAASASELQEKLKLIYHDLYEWRNNFYQVYNTVKELNAVREVQKTAIQDCDGIIQKCFEYQQKRTRKKYLLFKSGVVALIFVAMTFTILSFFEQFKCWSTIVGAIIGALDFCFGLGFQLYERKDDMKQKNNTQSAQQSLQRRKEQIKEKEAGINQSIVQTATTITNIHQEASGDNNTQIVNITI